MKITADNLRALAPRAKDEIIVPLAAAMNSVLTGYGITTPLRICHFVAQSAHETAGFATLNEYGSSAYFEKRYGKDTRVGRKLGNSEPGDGARFHGRGIFQCTGRANYAYYGRKIDVDLLANPSLAAQPQNSLKIACEYWKAKGLNALADRDDITGITEKINGGHNGLAERAAYLAKAKTIFVEEPAPVAAEPVEPAKPKPAPKAPKPDPVPTLPPDAPIAQDPTPSAAGSPTVVGAVTTVAGSGALSVLSYIQSPYALAALAIIILAAGIIIWRWMKRRDAVGV